MAVLTHDDLVALLRRTTDRDGWLDPILADPDGEAAMGAQVEVFARASVGVDYNAALGLISRSPGGQPGASSILVSRGTSGTSGTIPRGYLFRDARGAQAVVQTPVPVASGALSVSLPVETLRRTEAVNFADDPVFEVDPDAGVVLDSLGTTALIAPLGDPAAVATTFQEVGEGDPISGGASDWLSVHGDERGQQRQAGESTESYRARVRNIPDAVSPIAIGDGVLAAAARLGIEARVLEPFSDGATAALKDVHGLGEIFPLFASSTNSAGTAAAAALSPGADFLDDDVPEREVLDRRMATAYLRVMLAGLPRDPGFAVLYLDDGFADDPVAGYPDVGFPSVVSAQGMAIWEEVYRKKAGGVQHDVQLDVATRERGSGSTAAAVETVVFTIAPAAGRGWVFAEAIGGLDGALNAFPPGAVLPLAAYWRLRLTWLDGSTSLGPVMSNRGASRLTLQALAASGARVQPITQVEGIAISDGAVTARLVATVFVLEMLLP